MSGPCKNGLAALVAVLVIAASSWGQNVLLDHVDGLWAPDTIATGSSVQFHIRIVTGDSAYWGVSNGFRVYSPDGAEWGSTEGNWSGAVTDSMFPQQLVTTHSATGEGADTVGFAGFRWSQNTSLPPNFDAVAWTINIGPIADSSGGLTVCLDSTFYRPSNTWKWVPAGNALVDVFPEWDGPHCYTIVIQTGCCELRGDVDDDGYGPDIDDLVYLNDYVNLGGPEPPCMDQADVDDSGEVDADDLTYLWNYMFSGGPAPVACR